MYICCEGREFEGEVRREKERLIQHTDRSQGYYVSYLRVNRYPYNVVDLFPKLHTFLL